MSLNSTTHATYLELSVMPWGKRCPIWWDDIYMVMVTWW